MQAVSKFSRDNARTPMQWSKDKNAGFTTGTPWLKLNPNYPVINAAAQQDDPDSVLSFYKKLIALRKNPEYKDTLVYGSLEPLWENQHNLMAYYRKGAKTLLVIGNFQQETQTVILPQGNYKLLLNSDSILNIEDSRLTLRGYQVLILAENETAGADMKKTSSIHEC